MNKNDELLKLVNKKYKSNILSDMEHRLFIRIINNRLSIDIIDEIKKIIMKDDELYSEMVKLYPILSVTSKSMYKQFISESNINFSNDQKIGLSKLFKFILSNEKNYYLLGNSGTGKTMLIIKFIKFIVLKKYFKNIIFCSPNNHIRKLLKSYFFDNSASLDDSIYSNVKFSTLHKFLGFTKKINLNSGKIELKQTKNINYFSNDLIIIDECSSISKSLMNILKENKFYKIIYAGDNCSLTPENENINEIFKTNLNNFTLTKNMRSNDKNILKLSKHLGKWIYDKNYNFEINKFVGKNVKYYKQNIDNSKWNDMIVNKFLSMERSCIIIGWTNKQCKYYNNFIRNKLLSDPNDDYALDNILIFKNYYARGNIKFNIGDQVKILKKNNTTINLLKFSLNLPYDFKSIHKDQILPLYINCMKLINDNNNFEYDVLNLTVKKLGKNNDEFTIYVISNDGKQHYNNEKMYAYEQFKLLSDKIYNITNKNDDIFIEYIWKQFQTIYESLFAHLETSYCLNVYSAQGLTFDDVFVDVKDIIKNPNMNEGKRCMYTAITRAKNKIYLTY